MYLGVDYYPEQWPDSCLEQDLHSIRELGANVIRIGEFAWYLMEPQDGVFDFSYFDRVIERAGAYGLKVMFGTPTATMPAWLARQHPDILSEFEDGQKRAFGGRRQYCFNSEVYRCYTKRIVQKLAEHYRGEPAIVAWQLDNEFGHEGSDLCWCSNCQKAFRRFLRQKYASIGELNHRWGTAFWGQGYTDFEQIDLPRATITIHNPAMRMDHELFRAQSVTEYAKLQYETLKSVLPNAVIIHDFSGGTLEKHMDIADIANKAMDVVAYNNYPVWGGQMEPLQPEQIAFALDTMRGLKKKNFWITEQIMGAQGHDYIGYLPRPGQAALWSYQGMLHGCESMLYFRYRNGVAGAEQHCCGILGPDNVRRGRWNETQQFFRNIQAVQDVLESPITSEVAILHDYPSRASWRIQPQSQAFCYTTELERWYRPLYRSNIPVDVLPSGSDLSSYRLVILPVMAVGTEEMAQRLKDYVANGGHLVLTYRTFSKDRFNNFILGQCAPMMLCDLTGCEVANAESFDREGAVSVSGNGMQGTVSVQREMLDLKGAQAILHYDDPFYAGIPAACENQYGKGKVYYVGCAPDKALADQLMERFLQQVHLEGVQSPNGVEVICRSSASRTVTFYLNHADRPVQAACGQLAPYECRWVEDSER